MAELRKRLERLKNQEKSSLIDDLRIVLFASVLYKPKAERVFKPFPIGFHIPNSKEADFELLKACFEKIIVKGLDDVFEDPKAVSLLDHILNDTSIDLNKIELSSIIQSDDKLSSMFTLSVAKTPATKPRHIFQILPKQKSFKNERFNQMRNEFGSFFAFHGTMMHNARSILEFGLINVFNQRQVFGNGIYLTTELSQTFDYSPFNQNFFPGSLLGSKLSAVLLCEVISHPLIMEKDNLGSRVGVPRSYYVVPNSEWIRVDSIMLYSNANSVQQPVSQQKKIQQPDKPKLHKSDEKEANEVINPPAWWPFDSGTSIVIGLFIILFAFGSFMTKDSDPFL